MYLVVSKESENMYVKLQEFLSRCNENFLNNLKNSFEIAKTSNQGKIFLKQQKHNKNAREYSP
ncbi:hypothetical protein L6494_25700 [Nostoc sp. UHCC 0870]|uniref:hypothetical protein n=2 Tax=Nostoc sp. UHCC 0870 TaxID=2914041 RepID=UPI001EE08FDB|nr:hypothetical protein [Nostoc sp. UHCC 0870]UKO97905.1 hypothetical protein L6494_25700 [Nostoc sp. UHCC 0870]